MSLGTFSNAKRVPSGNRFIVTGTYTPAASTGASGDAVTAAALKSIGLSSLDQMVMQNLHGNTGANMAGIAWRRGTDGKGTIHIFDMGGGAHTHSFLVKGGAAAASTDALSIKGTTPVTIGKEAVTDATNVGGVGGGVQANAAGSTTAVRQSGGDFSTFKSEFWALGR